MMPDCVETTADCCLRCTATGCSTVWKPGSAVYVTHVGHNEDALRRQPAE